VKTFFNRLLIYTVSFLLGGAVGSALFYMWALGKAFSSRTYDRWARRWVTNMALEDLYWWMKAAFVAGGLLAVASVFKILWNKDRGRFDL